MGVVYDPILDALRKKDEGGGVGGGWTVIQEEVISVAVASILFQDELTDTHKEYRLTWKGVILSGTGLLGAEFGRGAGPTYPGSVYNHMLVGGTSGSSTPNIIRSTTQAVMFLSDNLVVGAIRNGTLIIKNLRDATKSPSAELIQEAHFEPDTTRYMRDGTVGFIDTANKYDSILLRPVTPVNITAGTFLLEGK